MCIYIYIYNGGEDVLTVGGRFGDEEEVEVEMSVPAASHCRRYQCLRLPSNLPRHMHNLFGLRGTLPSGDKSFLCCFSLTATTSTLLLLPCRRLKYFILITISLESVSFLMQTRNYPTRPPFPIQLEVAEYHRHPSYIPISLYLTIVILLANTI